MSSDQRSTDHAGELGVDDDLSTWGWHHTFGKGIRATGWVVSIVMLTMIIGNHEGHVEDYWLVAVALIMIFALVLDIGKRRKSWRR